MNTLFEQMRSWVDRLVVRVTAAVDPPLAADARPLEIQGAIVDDVELRTEPIGGGRRVLPYDQVAVIVLAPDKEDRAALHTALASLQEVVCGRLRELRCQPPSSLKVSVGYVTQPPADWPAGQRFAIHYGAPDVPGTPAAAPVTPPPLHVTIVRGHAAEPSCTLIERQVHIGRTAAPVDSSGHVRRNHIAFADDDGDEHSRSVGRAHASIRYQPGRHVYQLFDDGSRNGTRVVRDGATLAVVRRDPVGTTIQSGDEIQFGTAAIRVRIDPPA